MEEEKVENTGEPAEEQAQGSEDTASNFQMPEKFQGRTAEDIAKQYVELETQLGKKNQSSAELSEIKNSLTELRNVLDSKSKDTNESSEDLIKQHKDYIKSMGFATQDEVEKARLQGRKEAEYDRINDNLASKYDGKDGRPKYDRKEIEEFARENKDKGYTSIPPETLYKIKYEAELSDWNLKQALKGNKAPGVPESKKGVSSPKDGKDIGTMSEDERREHVKQKFQADL